MGFESLLKNKEESILLSNGQEFHILDATMEKALLAKVAESGFS